MLAPRARKRVRSRPSAAVVPKDVASTVDTVAMCRLVHADPSHSRLPSTFPYHLSVKPCHSDVKRESLNENRTSRTIGAYRNT